jgi:hypothetical protein
MSRENEYLRSKMNDRELGKLHDAAETMNTKAVDLKRC